LHSTERKIQEKIWSVCKIQSVISIYRNNDVRYLMVLRRK
jgi:hypothetical protein